MRSGAALYKLALLLGFRRYYALDLYLSAVGVAVYFSGQAVIGDRLYIVALSGFILALPALLRVYRYLTTRRAARRAGVRARLTPPTTPLAIVALSAVMAGFDARFLPVAIVNALLLEDFLAFAAGYELDVVRRGARVLLAPLSRRDLTLLTVTVAAVSGAAYYVTGSKLVFLYPIVTYLLELYGIVYVPPEYSIRRAPSTAGGGSLLEDVVSWFPYPFYMFVRFYNTARRVRQGKEAGYIGASYYVFIRRVAGLFTMSILTSLALAPILYALVGPISFFAVLALLTIIFFSPILVFSAKRSRRKSRITRSLLLVLSYFASMVKVSRDFTEVFQHLRRNPALAKMFGLDEEARIYLNIYQKSGSTEATLYEYADTVPDEFYRDTLRTVSDLYENEGPGAVFRTLLERLRDYTARLLTEMEAQFTSRVTQIGSVLLVGQAMLAMIIGLLEPVNLPLVVLGFGLLGNAVIFTLIMSGIPALPADFPHFKERIRRGAPFVFIVVASLLAVVSHLLVPELEPYTIILSAAPAAAVAIYYASKEDMDLDTDMLSKFGDLLILFSNGMSRTNDIVETLHDLSRQAGFTIRMRRMFARLANMIRVLGPESITYKGPFWWKYFLFIVSVTSRYGSTPRDLYRALSEFTLSFRQFLARVRVTASSFLMITVIILLLINMSTVLVSLLSSMMYEQVSGLGGAALSVPLLTVLSPEQAFQVKVKTMAFLLVVSLLYGAIISAIKTGTLRDGRWMLLLYLYQLVLAWLVLKHDMLLPALFGLD